MNTIDAEEYQRTIALLCKAGKMEQEAREKAEAKLGEIRALCGEITPEFWKFPYIVDDKTYRAVLKIQEIAQ